MGWPEPKEATKAVGMPATPASTVNPFAARTSCSSFGSWRRTSSASPGLMLSSTVLATDASTDVARDWSTPNRATRSPSIDSRVTDRSGPGGNVCRCGFNSDGSCEMKSFASPGVSRRTTV